MNNANDLMVQAAAIGVESLVGLNGGTNISSGSWLNSQNKVRVLSSTLWVSTDSDSWSNCTNSASWRWATLKSCTARKSSSSMVSNPYDVHIYNAC